MKLNIKPLSVNEAWQGRRFKTDKYKRYETAVILMLPKLTLPEPPLRLYLEFGFSNPCADIDNPVKSFLDCLQKKYGINDKHVSDLHIKKEIVKKGAEYIDFEIQAA